MFQYIKRSFAVMFTKTLYFNVTMSFTQKELRFELLLREAYPRYVAVINRDKTLMVKHDIANVLLISLAIAKRLFF